MSGRIRIKFNFSVNYFQKSLAPAMRYALLLAVLMAMTAALSGCKRQSSESLVQQGIVHAEQGNHRGAVVAFKSALESRPNDLEARYRLAESYFHLGQYAVAEKELRKLVLQDGNYPELPLLLARIYLKTDRAVEALQLLDHYATTSPLNADFHYLKGRAFVQLHNESAAEQALTQALHREPGHLPSRLALAELYTTSRRYEDGREMLRGILTLDENNRTALHLLARINFSDDRKVEALAAYERLAALDSDDIEARYRAALICFNLQEFTKAQQLADELLQRFPQQPHGHRLQGIAAFFSNDPTLAVVSLLLGIKDSEDLISRYFLGVSHYQLAEFEQALNQFQKILDLHPDYAPARTMVAMTLFKQQRVADALVAAQRSAQIDPNNPMTFNVLGSIHLALGDYDQAMVDFDRAVELNPQLVTPHVHKGLFNFASGRPLTAMAELSQALAVAPEVLNVRLLLAALLLRQQNYPQAITLLQQGLVGSPQDAMLYQAIAAACFAQQQPEPAIVALGAAKKIDPGYFTPYFSLASHYAAGGDYAAALHEYRQVLEQQADHLQALIACAAMCALQGQEELAAGYFEKARLTGQPQGFIVLAQYLLRDQHKTDAVQVLEDGLVVHPQHPLLLEMLGALLLEMGEVERAHVFLRRLEAISSGRGIALMVDDYLDRGQDAHAIALCDQLIANAPDASNGYLLAASIHSRHHDYAKAQQALERGLSVDNPIPVKMRLGSLFETMGQYPLAAQHYQQIVERFADYYPALFALGALEDRQGNKRAALSYYQKVLTLAPDFEPNLNNLAYLYADNYRNLEQALTLAFQAYRRGPTRPYVMDTLGYVLLKNGRAAEAKDLLEKAFQLLPDNGTVAYHLVLVYQALGEFEKSRALLLKVDSFAVFPEQQQMRDLFTSLSNAQG